MVALNTTERISASLHADRGDAQVLRTEILNENVPDVRIVVERQNMRSDVLHIHRMTARMTERRTFSGQHPAVITTAIARTSMTPMTRIVVRPAQQQLQWKCVGRLQIHIYVDAIATGVHGAGARRTGRDIGLARIR
jgi:hypothetical protein